MSFMLIRILQTFSSILLDTASQPPETRVPRSWAIAKGRKVIEKIWPKTHLTMYATGLLLVSVLANISVQGGLWVKTEEAKYA